MDNDLMARRLRPPSQPNSGNAQQPADPPGQPSPWDVPLTSDGQFAPPQSQTPQNDPPFAPQFGQPDPAAHADVPWDRPAPEAWPPTEQTWSAGGGDPAVAGDWPAAADPDMPPRPDWPAADALGDSAAPWDRPDNAAVDQWRDPDDAFAPVIADVQVPATLAAWNSNGNSNGNANSNGHSNGADNGIYFATPSNPERMTVAAHSDQPPAGDQPTPIDQPPAAGQAYSSGSNPLPDWPAEDDLTVIPPSGHGPVMPEDSWPVTPAWPPLEPPAPPAPPDWTEPAVSADQPDAQPDAQPEPEPEPESEPHVPTTPPAPAPRVEVSTPPNTQIVAVTPTGTPQNMVLRIELAIVDESHRANPAESAKRVGPDADVRHPEYEPRNSGGPASMPEPEYIWDAPPAAKGQKPQDQQLPRPRPGQPVQPAYRPQPPQHVAPPPSAWLPASQAAQPQQPQNLDWDLPPVAPAQPMADPPAPWSTPAAPPPHQPSAQSPYAPAPTWAMTQPAPTYQPEPPQYIAPPAPQYQQPSAPQYPQAAPPYQPPAAPQYPQPDDPFQPHDPLQQAGYQPARQPDWPPVQQPFSQPTRPQQMPQPLQSAPLVQSAPADLWFLNNQPAAPSAIDADVQPEAKSNSILTAGLTIGFALLVIVLVLVFIQLMTSLLR